MTLAPIRSVSCQPSSCVQAGLTELSVPSRPATIMTSVDSVHMRLRSAVLWATRFSRVWFSRRSASTAMRRSLTSRRMAVTKVLPSLVQLDADASRWLGEPFLRRAVSSIGRLQRVAVADAP